MYHLVPRAFLVAATSILIAGCIAGSDRPDTQGSHETASAQPAWTAGNAAFNLTGCMGATLKVQLPHAVVAAATPPSYTPFQQLPGQSMMVVRSFSCSKLAESGHDVGPGSWFLAYVPISPPSSNAPPAGWVSAYLLETGSNVSALSSFTSARKIATTNVRHTMSVTAFPIAFEVVRGSLDVTGGPNLLTYEVRPNTFTRQVRDSVRLFYGETPAGGHLSWTASGTDSSGDGAGWIQLTSASRTRETVNGASVIHAVGVKTTRNMVLGGA